MGKQEEVMSCSQGDSRRLSPVAPGDGLHQALGSRVEVSTAQEMPQNTKAHPRDKDCQRGSQPPWPQAGRGPEPPPGWGPAAGPRQHRLRLVHTLDTDTGELAGPGNLHLMLVLVSWGCRNQVPRTRWLKTTEIYSLTVLEARSLR